MICINKEEAMMLRRIKPDVVIRRTMKQKTKRHKYVVEDLYWVKKALKNFREGVTNNG